MSWLKPLLIAAAIAAPTFFVRGAHAADFCNMPTGGTVTLGFNVPQTGAYADEGADEDEDPDIGAPTAGSTLGIGGKKVFKMY